MESTPGPLVKPQGRHPFTIEQEHPGRMRLARPAEGSLRSETVREANGHTRLLLHGSLQARTAVAFKQALLEVVRTIDGSLTLDLSGIRRIDPTGLAALAEACELGRRHGRRVQVTHLPACARRWITLASLHKVIELCE